MTSILLFLLSKFEQEGYLCFAFLRFLSINTFSEQLIREFKPLKREDFDQNVAILLHEFVHALGFINLPYHKIPQLSLLNRDKNLASSLPRYTKENVVAWAREHYKCPQIHFMPLDDQDTKQPGSHWPKFFVGNELMTPRAEINLVFSGLTYALLKDLGHYIVNDTMEEYLSFGKDSGCGIFEGGCEGHHLSCPAGASGRQPPRCTSDHFGIGKCSEKDGFPTGCSLILEAHDCRVRAGSVRIPIKHRHQSYGLGSRCLIGKLFPDQFKQKAHCVKSTCDTQKLRATFEIHGEKYTCSAGETGVRKYLKESETHYLICPDTTKMCQKGLNCPNECNFNGRCLKTGKCFCYTPWKGEDCSIPVPENERFSPTVVLPFKFLTKLSFANNWSILFLILFCFLVGFRACFQGRSQFLVRSLKFMLTYQFLNKFLYLDLGLEDFQLGLLSKLHGIDTVTFFGLFEFFRRGPIEMISASSNPKAVIVADLTMLVCLVLLTIGRINFLGKLLSRIILSISSAGLVLTLGNSFFYSLQLLVNQDSISRAQRRNTDLRVPVVSLAVVVIITVTIFVFNHKRRYEAGILELQKLARTGLKNEHFQTPKLARHITIGILGRYLVMLALIAASNKIPPVVLMTLLFLIQLSIMIFVVFEGVLKDQFLSGWESLAVLFNELFLSVLFTVGLVIKVDKWEYFNKDELAGKFLFCLMVTCLLQVLAYVIVILVEFRCFEDQQVTTGGYRRLPGSDRGAEMSSVSARLSKHRKATSSSGLTLGQLVELKENQK